MLGTAGSYTAFMACKSIGAVGLGHLYTGGTIYGVESLPPRKRGFLLASTLSAWHWEISRQLLSVMAPLR